VPLRFGTVFADRDAVVSEFLAPRYDELTATLRRLDGLAELTVRAFYREDDVLRALLAEHPRLARLRAAARDGDQGFALQLGEAVARALSARRDDDAEAIVAALRPLARAVVLDERRTELEVVRAAFLVGRGALRNLDA